MIINKKTQIPALGGGKGGERYKIIDGNRISANMNSSNLRGKFKFII